MVPGGRPESRLPERWLDRIPDAGTAASCLSLPAADRAPNRVPCVYCLVVYLAGCQPCRLVLVRADRGSFALSSPRVLAIDDDPMLLSVMRRGLAFAGYSVDVATSGAEALVIARDRFPDLVILDLMMPGMDGMEVCRRLRAGDEQLPIIMLTARDRVPDRIAGLDAGADDYITKPFDFDELLARIRAQLRRVGARSEVHLRFADVTLDPGTRIARRGERILDLTTREHDLLELFLRNPRQVLSREQIFERLWGADSTPESNVIDVHVKRLRDKLETSDEPRLIHAIRGIGYSLREE